MTAAPDQVARFWAKVEPEPNSGCWIWVGGRQEGYGRTWDGTRRQLAHRFSYELERGPIPDGLQLDHLCRNPWCVNPWHLDPVTNRENARRGRTGWVNREKTHCARGHPYDGAWASKSENRLRRMCIQCHREKGRRYYWRHRAS